MKRKRRSTEMKPEKGETYFGHELTRRKFIGLMVATSGAAISAPYLAGAKDKGSVTYFSYATYTDPRLIGDFTKETGIKLKTQSVGSTDLLVSRLKATRGKGLDVAMASLQTIQDLYRAGIYAPIDVSRLKNWKYVYPQFQKASFLQTGIEGKITAVPFVWGPEGLIYRTDKIDKVTSWADLWDKRYKGRIAMPDYAYESILIAAEVLGYHENIRKDPIVFTDAQYDAIKAKLIEQKPLVTKYWSSCAEGASLVVGGEAWLSVGRICMLEPARKERASVKLIAPKEGAMGWCTSNGILTASENVDAAYELADYFLGKTYSGRLTKIKGYPLANKRMMMEMSESERNEKMLNDPNLLTSMVWWNRAADPQRFTNLWNEVKAR